MRVSFLPSSAQTDSAKQERNEDGERTDSITDTPFFLGAPLAPAGKKVLKKLGSSFFMSTSRSLLLLRICFLGSTGFSGPLAALMRSLTRDIACRRNGMNETKRSGRERETRREGREAENKPCDR